MIPYFTLPFTELARIFFRWIKYSICVGYAYFSCIYKKKITSDVIKLLGVVVMLLSFEKLNSSLILIKTIGFIKCTELELKPAFFYGSMF